MIIFDQITALMGCMAMKHCLHKIRITGVHYFYPAYISMDVCVANINSLPTNDKISRQFSLPGGGGHTGDSDVMHVICSDKKNKK